MALKRHDRTVAIVFVDGQNFITVAGNRVAGPFRQLGDAERVANGLERIVIVELDEASS